MKKNSLIQDQGNRLRAFREQTGMTRSSFSKRSGISEHTLRSWEIGERPLTEKKALLLSNIFKVLGMKVSTDLLLYGKKMPTVAPLFPGQWPISGTSAEDFQITHEVDFFKQNNPDYLLHIVQDQLMEPLFNKEDIVGGTKTIDIQAFSQYLGMICIIESKAGKKYVRKVVHVSNNAVTGCILNPSYKLPISTTEAIITSAIAPVTRHWCLSNVVRTLETQEPTKNRL